LVLAEQQQALQLLLPWQGVLPRGQELTHHLGDVLNRVRLLATEISVSGRFPGGEVTLPNRWIYSPETESGLRQCIEQLRRSWAGDQTTLERPLLLLSGSPGTGKSSLAEWFAHTIVGDPSPDIRESGGLKSVEHGGTEKNLAELVDKLLKRTPRALILNEIEQFTRKEGVDPIHGDITAAFKTQMDRVVAYTRHNQNARILVIGTTNHIELIEDGVLSRAQVVEFSFGREECMRLLDILIRQDWEEEAKSELQRLAGYWKYDPRKISDLVLRAESNASRDSTDAFGARFTVKRSHVGAGAIGTPAKWGEAQDDFREAPGANGGFDTRRVQTLLLDILGEARRSGVKTDGGLTLVDKNQLPFLRRLFPDWARELNEIKREKGRPPLLYD
jgi:hypothetical protein